MSSRKCNCPPEGAPEWVMTYGDMMSLLLCFFIILVALSEIKKEDQYRAIVEEVQKAFGMKGGGGNLPTEQDPEMTLIERLDHLQLQSQQMPEVSHDADPGTDGRRREVTTIREATYYVQGGRITFDTGSAELSQASQRQLDRVAELVRGYNNKIELRGHAASMEINSAPDGMDLYALSHARASAVMRYLVDKADIRPERIRLIASADHEPIKRRVLTAALQEPNRRVEIHISDALIDDLNHHESESAWSGFWQSQ